MVYFDFIAQENTGMTAIESQALLTATNPLSKKLARIFHLRLDEPEIQDALAALSSFYTDNTASARRSLNNDIERRLIGLNQRYLDSFQLVQLKMKAIEEQIGLLGLRCATMDDQLRSAYNDTASVLKHTQDIKAKSEQSAQRKLVVDIFLKRFSLSDAEVRLLTTSSETVNSRFFAALSHLAGIQDDCKTLLMTDNQRLGQEIMEIMAGHQEAAFDKLFRWTQAELRLMKNEATEITVDLKQGVNALKQKPILFQSCMDEVSNIRRVALLNGFRDALTVGGPGGFPRPIDFHAHDALRYIGDILAWVHQTVVSEREMLEGLFGLASSAFKRRGSFSLSQETPIDKVEGCRADEELLLSVLDKNLEAIGPNLKQRLLAVLSSGLGPITSYRVANLTKFYMDIITKVVGASSQLMLVLKELSENTLKVFFDALNAQANDMLQFVQFPGNDLEPPQTVKDTIAQLREIMLSYDGSLSTSSERDAEFDAIVGGLVGPLLEMCSLAAQPLKPLESAMFRVNCLNYIQTTLTSFSFTSTHIQTLETQIDEQVDILVNEQYSVILKQSGLEPLVRHMDSMQPPFALSKFTDSKAVSDAMAKLGVFLVTVTVDVSETLSRINSVQISRRVSHLGFHRFVEVYRRVYNNIMNPKNKYEFPSSLLNRTVEEVETLLSLL